MDCVESIGAGVRAAAAGYFLLDLEFSDSTLRGVVVRWYRRGFRKLKI